MAEGQEFDAAEFEDQLSAMTDEELFALMQKLEDESKNIPSEERFLGQRLAPYKDWQQRRDRGT